MWKFESSVEKRVEKEDRIEKGSERAKEIYEKYETEAMNERDFEDLYSKKQVNKDLDYVKEKEEEYEKKNTPEQKRAKKIATIFEAIVFDQGERSNWLGESVTTIKSSHFDDIKNGVDLIAEFPDEEKTTASHLALAVDVTFSDDLKEKMDRIKDDIKQNKLATIKYFNSDFLKIRGEIRDIPKVVVGADRRTLENVIDLWIVKDNKSLATHPIQFIILEEILNQLEGYREYAEKLNKQKIVKNYDRAIQTLEDINRKKQVLREKVLAGDTSIIENDNVYRAINEYLEKELIRTSTQY